MQKRKLGELEVSAVGLGCMGYGVVYDENYDKKQLISIIHEAIELGINFFDTAEALYVFAMGGFGFAVPSAPSGIGPFEWAIIFGLSLIGVEKTIAAPYALVYHMMGIVPITIVGFIFLFIMGINLKEATSQNQ